MAEGVAMTCPSGKVTYRDPDTAARMATALGELKFATPMRSYRCPHCDGYHTTSKRKRRLARPQVAP